MSWDGGGDGTHWSDPANWQADVLPGVDDDVVIGVGASTVLIDSGTRAVHSLVTAAPLEISGGKLAIGTTFLINSAVTLRGGTIEGGILTQGTGDLLLTSGGGVLDSVTLNGSLDLAVFRANATIRNGFTLNGTASFGRDGLLFFEGTQSFSGEAVVEFRNEPGATNGLVARTDGMTLTIGEHVTLSGGNSDVGGTTIGYNPYTEGGTNTSIINRGKIIPDIAGGRIIIRPRGTGTFTNLGQISIEGGTLDLEADATIASLGDISRTAGNFRLFRTIDLMGQEVDLADVAGPWTLQGGTIKNGTINQSAEATLILSASGGILDDVKLNGAWDLTPFRSKATIKNGLTFNGTATMGADALLSFDGTQSLDGEATFLFQNVPGATNGLVTSTDGMTLTIGENITIRGGNSDVGGTTIGLNPYSQSGTNTSVVNLGTIIADTAGGRIVIRPRGTGTFSNLGHIWIAGGTLDLDADATPSSLGDIIRTAGSLRLFRTMDLTGLTVNLADLAGPWTLQGGTIKGGNITESGDAKLFLSPSGGTLDGVTLNGPLDMTAFRSKATIKNGLTFNGTATMGADGLLSFEGTQTLDGIATFLMQNVPGATNGLVTASNGMTLTIGENITIRGGNSDEGGATIGLNPYAPFGANASIINRGTIISETSGGRIVIRPHGSGTFTNLGSMEVLDSAILEVTTSLSIPNPSNVHVATGGILRVAGSVLAASTDSSELSGTFQLNGSGTALSPQLFEVRSEDLGLAQLGFFDNSAINSLVLSNSTYVKLVNQFDNSSGTEPEVLYAKSISIPAGTTLDLNGLTVYTTSLQQSGTVSNGTIKQIAPISAINVGQTVNNTIAVGQTRYYQVNIGAGLEPEFLLKGLPTSGIVEMYIKREGLPTRTSFDWSSTQPFAAEQSIDLQPVGSTGTYFILIYAPSLATSPAIFQLKVSAPIFEVRTTNFGTAGNGGDFTLKALGANFDSQVNVRLTKPSGFQLAAKSYVAGESEFYATFDLSGVAPGTYNVIFTNKNGVTVTLPNSLTVTSTTEPAAVVPRIVAPSAIRRGREFSFTVEWTNTSLNDAAVPLLTVGSTVSFGLGHNDYSLGTRYTFLGTNTHGGPAGILRPGQTETLSFWSYSDTEPGEYTVFVDRVNKDPESLFDWQEIRPQLTPPGVSDAEFAPLFQQLILQVGPTWGDYLAMLGRNASLVPAKIGMSSNPLNLLAVELSKARAVITPSIQGRITLPSDVFLSDVEFGVVNQTDASRYSALILNDGSFILHGLTPGHYSLVAPGYLIVDATNGAFDITPSSYFHDVEIELGRGRELGLGVRDRTSQVPLENAFIALYDGTTSVSAGITDSAGVAKITGLGPTLLNAVIDRAGYARTYVNGISPSSLSSVEYVELAPESVLRIHVQLPGGIQATEALVMATRRNTAVDSNFFGSAAGGDSTSLTGLSAGVYDLVIAAPGMDGTTIEGVLLGTGEQKDLGIVQLQSLPIPAPAAGEVTANSIASGVMAILLPILEETVRARIVLLPAARGFEFTNICLKFLDNSPYTIPVYGFADGSTTVEGNLTFTDNPGFRHHPITSSRVSEAYNAAMAEIERRIKDGEIFPSDVCGPNGESERVFTLDELLSNTQPWLLYVSGDEPGPNPLGWDYAGTLAGGLGHGGTPGVELIPDERLIEGEIVVSASGTNTVKAEARNISFTVGDTFDFFPGDLGPHPLPGLITLDLRTLEVYGAAFDIGVVIRWQHRDPLPTRTFSLPGVDCCDDCDDGPPDSKATIKRPVSIDPNDIIGPASVGPQNHIVPDNLMPYIIRFENAANAEAPAATVTVTQQLDADLDWTTFRLGDIGFGNTIIVVPANTAFYQTRVDLRETRGVFVDVTAGINAGTGEVRWEFVSIDPATDEPPENPLVGFLPPNVTGPQGEGFLNYTVRAKASVVTGDRIDAVAPIVFDVNEPIVTPPIFHTIDDGSPASHVLPLAPSIATPTFTVTWAGNDDEGGAGIATYNIFVSDNGGDYTSTLDNTTATSFEFTGTPGHTYAFYSVANDLVGHTEAAPLAADTTTTIAAAVDHNPTVMGGTFTLNENSPSNTIVGTVTASDPDGDALTFSIIDGNLLEAFAIDPVSGQISVLNTAAIDFESRPSFDLSVRVQDSTGLTHAAIVRINLLDLNEALQLHLGGAEVTWINKQDPVVVLPQVMVNGAANLTAGTLALTISNFVGSSKKRLDKIGLPSFASFGTSNGPQFSTGQLSLEIQLDAGATNQAIQDFLRGLTFTTKGKGLKTLNRSVQVTLTADGQSSSISQTIQVRKK